MKAKNYWFALKSYVYVEFKEKNILIYDTKHGNRIEAVQAKVITLIKEMYKPGNLGVIPISNKLQSDPYIRNFIQEVIDKEMGDLMDTEHFPNKPVRLIPTLSLQKDIDRHIEYEDKVAFIGKDISKYLTEVNVYLNSICDKSCKHCAGYCKQIHCCTTNNPGIELPIEQVRSLLEQLRYSPVNTINLYGGDILSYSYLNELQLLASSYPKTLHFYTHHKNYRENEFVDSQLLELIITFPMDGNHFHELWKQIKDKQSKLHFIVEDEQQYYDSARLINEYNIKEYSIHPYYTGENIHFFEDNIFLNKEEIFYKALQMREIFRNQKLNSNSFGTLYVLPDGTVKANMNTAVLGNIAEDDILDIIYKELIENTAWRTIRNSHPCDQCIYQFMCPAPSNYERAIGKNNLCHIIN
ncbi:TIGR04150 pseudo-rSAM protein [Bacteroides timonensis]|uniref:TIGR04150 pseudo-rSAM protein n=1 Tax=Bacteroides timonensis TaxID=1470345 RepID=UPI0004B43D1D|nr:TIGR04150 pseudo-rSAM protein [Bacteroides timonensis]